MKLPHPSGKPVREPRVIRPSMWRVPLDGYVTPRLRRTETDAIGFIHKFDEGNDE